MTLREIFSAAGWRPVPGWQDYERGACVGGVAPSGTLYIKSVAMIPPGHPQHGPDTPDTLEEAATWLVSRFGVAPAPEPEQPAAHETDSETVQEVAADSADDSGEVSQVHNNGSDDIEPEPSLGEAGQGSGEIVAAAAEGRSGAAGASEPLDADFTEVAPEFDGLDEPDPGDFAAIEGADLGAEILDEEAPAGAFIFGDNIHQQRIVRIGQLAEHAAAMIADTRSAVAWSDAEFADLQSHVVANLDKATGAYTGGDHEAYSRFVALSEAQARIRSIGAYRDARQDEVRGADREAVEAFNPEEGWP